MVALFSLRQRVIMKMYSWQYLGGGEFDVNEGKV